MKSTEPAAGAGRWLALMLIAAAQFMVIMDISIIGVAVPKMQQDLRFAPQDLSWLFNSYIIPLAGLLLLGGRMSDLLGARRVFAAGWVVLGVGSLLAGLADNAVQELAGRAVQGAGSALIAPAALTLLFAVFGGSGDLPRALALYGVAAPAGGTAGVFLGGVLTEWASWRWVFYINLPIVLVVLLLIPRVTPSGGRSRGPLDLTGAVAATTGLGALVFAIVRAPLAGWSGGSTMLGVGLGVVLLAVFIALQMRLRRPLMRLGILRVRNLAAANLAQILLGAAWIPMFMFVNLYLQQIRGMGAFASGAALLPLTVTLLVGMIVIAPQLNARFGSRVTTTAGLVTLAAGLVLLSFLDAGGSYPVDILPGTLVTAVGMAMAFIPSLGTALSSAAPDEAGLAAGVVNMSFQIGSALGLAAMTALAAAFGAADRLSSPVDLVNGFSAGLLGAASLAAVGAVTSFLLLKEPDPLPAHRTESEVAF